MQRSLSEAATYVLGQFGRLGIEVPERSRIKTIYRSVCNDDGSSRGLIQENDPDFDITREALRDFKQLEFFFDQIGDDARKDEYVSVLKKIAKDSDSVLPQDDEQDSPSRDAQAEAFVFAGCLKAGLNPSFKEPDVVCSLDGQEFPIAVKRIKNLKQLVKRISIGASQIAQIGGHGIVAVDVVIAMNPKNYRMIAKVPDIFFGLTWMCHLRNVVNKYHAKIQRVIQKKGVLAVILHDHWLRMDSHSHWRLETMTYRIPSTAIDRSVENRLEAFTQKYRRAFPNLTILTK